MDDAERKRHALVAGVGFVGAPLVRMLSERGWNVTGLARSESDGAIACDIADGDAVRALGGKYDAIIHCASSGRGPNREERYRAVYLEGTRNLLALEHGKFLFTGSTSVYAQTDGSIIDENSPAEPATATGRILREAEDLVLAADEHNVVARLAGIYGIGRSFLLKNFLGGKATIDALPDGDRDGRWVNQIHNEDAASALAFLAEHEQAHGIYNVADATPMRQRALYEAFSQRFHLPVPPVVKPDPNRKRGWSHKAVDSNKLARLAWIPRFPTYLDALDTLTEPMTSVANLPSLQDRAP